MAQLFRIEYEKDGIDYVEEGRFMDAAGVSAKEWAEDYAYTLADKGNYVVTAIRQLKTCPPSTS